MFFAYNSDHLRCYAVIKATNQNINHQCHGKPKKTRFKSRVLLRHFDWQIFAGVSGEHAPTVFRV
jgi:hypothetical protein